MTLTTDKIHETADMLSEQSIKPTLAEVRKALGGGSFTTISEAMKSWRQEQKKEEALQHVELPSNINERLQSLGAEMWHSAINTANDRLKADQEILALAESRAQAEINESQEAVKTLEAEQVDLLVQLDNLSNEAKRAKTDLIETRLELEKFRIQAKTNIDSVNQKINDTQHKFDIEKQRTETSTAMANELRSQLDDTRSHLMEARENIASYKATADAQLSEVDRLKSELIESKKQHEMTQLKLIDRTTERDTSQKELATAKGKLEVVSAQAEKIMVERDQLNISNKELTVNLVRSESRAETLEADKKRLVDELKK